MIKINKLLFAMATVLPTITCLTISVESVQASSATDWKDIKSQLNEFTDRNVNTIEGFFRKQRLLKNNETYWAKGSYKNSISALHDLTIWEMKRSDNFFEDRIDAFKEAIADAVENNSADKAGAYLNGLTIYTFLHWFINDKYIVNPQPSNKSDLEKFESTFQNIIDEIVETTLNANVCERLVTLITKNADKVDQLKEILVHDMKCYLFQIGYIVSILDKDNKHVNSVLGELFEKNKGLFKIDNVDNEEEKNTIVKNEKKNKKELKLENTIKSKPNVKLNFVTSAFGNETNNKNDESKQRPINVINEKKKNKNFKKPLDGKIINKKNTSSRKTNYNKKNINKMNINNINAGQSKISKLKSDVEKDDDFSLFSNVNQQVDVKQEFNSENSPTVGAAPLPVFNLKNQTGLQAIGLKVNEKTINNQKASYLEFDGIASNEFSKDDLIKNLVDGFNAISDNPRLRHGGLTGSEAYSQLTALIHALSLQPGFVQNVILNYLNKYKQIQTMKNSSDIKVKNSAILTSAVVELLAKVWILPKNYDATSKFAINNSNNLLKACENQFGNELQTLSPGALFNQIVDTMSEVLKTTYNESEVQEKLKNFVSEEIINKGLASTLAKHLQKDSSGVKDNMCVSEKATYFCQNDSCKKTGTVTKFNYSINVDLKDYQNDSIKNGVVRLIDILKSQYRTNYPVVDRCPHCNQNERIPLEKRLEFLPKNLVINFDRRKLQGLVNVNIPELLDLSDKTDPLDRVNIGNDVNNENNTKYFLSAVVFYDSSEDKYVTLGRADVNSGWVRYKGGGTTSENKTISSIRFYSLMKGIALAPHMAIYSKLQGQNVENTYTYAKESYEQWIKGIKNEYKKYMSTMDNSNDNNKLQNNNFNYGNNQDQKNIPSGSSVCEGSINGKYCNALDLSSNKLVKFSKNKDIEPSTIGLNNIGSICYMNSTNQSIANVYNLADYFLKKTDEGLKDVFDRSLEYKKCANIKDTDPVDNWNFSLSKQFYVLLKNLWIYNDNGKQSYSPQAFMDIITTMNPLFKQGQAADAKDYIIFVLEQLHKELKNQVSEKKMKELEQQCARYKSLDQYDKNNAFAYFCKDFASETSIISDLFFGIIETTNVCQNCKPKYNAIGKLEPVCYNYQKFNSLIFPLDEVRLYRDNMYINCLNNLKSYPIQSPFHILNPQNPYVTGFGKNEVTLKQCFEYNQKSELFTGANKNYCNICRQLYDSVYTSKPYVLPNVLIIILNRGKDNVFDVRMDVPLEIDLSPYEIKNPNNQGKADVYSLIGCINHIGQSGPSAHFVSTNRVKESYRFVRHNDAITDRIDNFNRDVVGLGKPYILFYKRKGF